MEFRQHYKCLLLIIVFKKKSEHKIFTLNREVYDEFVGNRVRGCGVSLDIFSWQLAGQDTTWEKIGGEEAEEADGKARWQVGSWAIAVVWYGSWFF